MENIFTGIKERIKNYEEHLSKGNITKDTSNLLKIEEEIKSLKDKIDKLNKEMEGKTKIEKMKMALNIISFESEISLKKLEFDKENKRVEVLQQEKITNYNMELENYKKELISFIENNETIIKNNVKGKSLDIVLNKDFEDVRGYYKKIMDSKESNLKPIQSKLERREELVAEVEKKIKVIQEDINDAMNTMPASTHKSMYILKRTMDKKELQKAIAAVEKELEELKIIDKAGVEKLMSINLMVDETIKELVQEELAKREIVFPEFVPFGKYFNINKEEVDE